VRITYDPAADAVYIHLTSDPLAPGRTTLQAPTPPGTSGFIALDWKDDRLVGIEILDASTRLHHDLLDQAEVTGKTAPSQEQNGTLSTERSRSVLVRAPCATASDAV